MSVEDEQKASDELDAWFERLNAQSQQVKQLEADYRKLNPEKAANDFVNARLTALGYKPLAEDPATGNNRWQLRITVDQKILPADYSAEGTLFELASTRDMRMFDVTAGQEPDLTDRQYNELDLFEWAAEQGYDGVKINDFAQSETHGNVGHVSWGFFKSAISDLKVVNKAPATHPGEKEAIARYSSPKLPQPLRALGASLLLCQAI